MTNKRILDGIAWDLHSNEMMEVVVDRDVRRKNYILLEKLYLAYGEQQQEVVFSLVE